MDPGYLRVVAFTANTATLLSTATGITGRRFLIWGMSAVGTTVTAAVIKDAASGNVVMQLPATNTNILLPVPIGAWEAPEFSATTVTTATVLVYYSII